MVMDRMPAWAVQPGIQVHVARDLPIEPTPGEDARRHVRHLYRSLRTQRREAMYFPDSLGPVGLLPGEEVHARMSEPRPDNREPDGVVMVSPELWRSLHDHPEALFNHISRADLYRKES